MFAIVLDIEQSKTKPFVNKFETVSVNLGARHTFLREYSLAPSLTRLGDLLDFGQLFKACGNN